MIENPISPEMLPAPPSISHLSYSITLYRECAAKFFYRYIAKLSVPTKPVLAVGIATHEAIEGQLAARARGETPASLLDLFEEAWGRAIAQEADWGSDGPDGYRVKGLLGFRQGQKQPPLTPIGLSLPVNQPVSIVSRVSRV